MHFPNKKQSCKCNLFADLLAFLHFFLIPACVLSLLLLQRSICSYYLPICTWFFKGTGSDPIGLFHITLRTHLFSFSAETISLLHISLLVCLQDLSEVRKAVSEGETSSCFRTDRYELRVPLRWVSISSIKSLNADDAVTEGYGVSVIYHCVFAHRRRSSWSAGS